MVNGGKMYPKAISMKLEDELNFEKKQNSKTKRNSQKSSKSSKTTKSNSNDDKMGTSNVHLDSAFETASTVSSKINDNTLDYGDWAIMEPGKFYYINGWFEIIFQWFISEFFPRKFKVFDFFLGPFFDALLQKNPRSFHSFRWN